MKNWLLIIIGTLAFQAGAQTKKIDSLKAVAARQSGTALADTWARLAYHTRLGNADSAFRYIDLSLNLSKQIGYTKGEAGALIIKGSIYIIQSKFEISLEHATKGLQIAQQIKNDSLIGYAKLGIGSYYYNKNYYELAIQNFLEANRIFEKINHPQGVIKVQSNIAMIYQLQGKLDQAEKLIESTLELIKQTATEDFQLSSLHTLANIYGMQGKYKEALAIDEQGLKLAAAIDSKFLTSQFYDNMANCYMYSGKYSLAYQNFNKCIVLDSSFGNRKQMADTYLNMGNLFLIQHKYDTAVQLLNYAILLSEQSGYRVAKFQSLRLLSDLYKETGNTAKALELLGQSHAVKDSISNIKTEEKIAELETVFQTEKKEQQLAVQQSQLKQKNLFIWGLSIALVMVALLALSIYRRRKLKEEINLQKAVMKEQDAATNAILFAEEKERKRIASDLHDGVGQLMSAAKMNLSAIEKEIPFQNDAQRLAYEKAIGLVDESCREIRDISHQMMPNALLKTGLFGAIKEFVDKIDHRVIKIHLHMEGLHEKLDSNVESILYRAVQECVNNVIKHSGANQLDISMIRETKQIAITIEDNGIGFDATDSNFVEGIGLKNIQSRVQFLKGEVDFDSAPGKGTLVAIHVPLSS